LSNIRHQKNNFFASTIEKPFLTPISLATSETGSVAVAVPAGLRYGPEQIVASLLTSDHSLIQNYRLNLFGELLK
jgi:hypothetical protein